MLKGIVASSVSYGSVPWAINATEMRSAETFDIKCFQIVMVQINIIYIREGCRNRGWQFRSYKVVWTSEENKYRRIYQENMQNRGE